MSQRSRERARRYAGVRHPPPTSGDSGGVPESPSHWAHIAAWVAKTIGIHQGHLPVPPCAHGPTIPQDTGDTDIAIGWFAHYRGDGRWVGFFDDNALVVTGTRESLAARTAMQLFAPWTYREIGLSEIIEALVAGYPIAFDAAAYDLFHPPASRRGVPLGPHLRPKSPSRGTDEAPLIRVQWMDGVMWIEDEEDDDLEDDDLEGDAF